jgi:site-specific recombinase XerD
MTATQMSSRLCLPFDAWPEVDQMAWNQSISGDDPFDDDDHYGATLRADTLKALRKGYGRWLAFLASKGWLDAAAAPLARVTVPRLRAYLRHLMRHGNAPATIEGRFCQLTTTMKMLAPGQDVSWIRKPDGATVRKLLPRQQKPVRVPPCEVLFDWGARMMASARREMDLPVALVKFRDGLLIAMLAARARRRTSMSLLTLGKEITKVNGVYRIDLTVQQTKNKKADRFDLPAVLTAEIDHYVEHVRPKLMGSRTHAAFWVAQSGAPLTMKGLTERIIVLSRKEFGYSFGPHAFRHAVSTMLAEHDPANPGLAAAVLNITPEVDAAHYNRARQMAAANRFAELIDGKRTALGTSR